MPRRCPPSSVTEPALPLSLSRPSPRPRCTSRRTDRSTAGRVSARRCGAQRRPRHAIVTRMGGDGTRAKGRGRLRARCGPRARPVARWRATGTPAQKSQVQIDRALRAPVPAHDPNHWQTVFRHTWGMPDEYNVTLRQADQALSDFAALAVSDEEHAGAAIPRRQDRRAVHRAAGAGSRRYRGFRCLMIRAMKEIEASRQAISVRRGVRVMRCSD